MGQDYIWTSLSTYGRRDTANASWSDMITFLKSFDKDDSSSVQLGCWNYLQGIGVSVKEMIEIRKIFLNDDSQPFPTLSVIHKTPKPVCSNKRQFTIALPCQPVLNLDFYNTVRSFDLTGKKISRKHHNRQRTPAVQIIQIMQ